MPNQVVVSNVHYIGNDLYVEYIPRTGKISLYTLETSTVGTTNVTNIVSLDRDMLASLYAFLRLKHKL